MSLAAVVDADQDHHHETYQRQSPLASRSPCSAWRPSRHERIAP